MKLFPTSCVLLAFASFSTLANAQVVDVSGNLLVSWCNTNINQERAGDWAMKGGACMGYLTAITDFQATGAAVAGHKSCISPNVNMNQIVDVFRQFIKAHPEKRHLLSANLAAEAFSQCVTGDFDAD
jgi:hypothetical protein